MRAFRVSTASIAATLLACWLNEVQAIGKLVELRVGPERSYARYDAYALR